MGDLLAFPARDRAQRPIATAAGMERWRILDQVLLPDEPTTPCGPQRGVIERAMLTPDGGTLWVRLHSGPRDGETVVIAADRAHRPQTLPFTDF